MVGTQVPRKRLSGDDLDEHPTNRHATELSTLNAKADDPACEHVHHHHDPVAAQEYRFAAEQIDAPQAVLHMPDKAQPGRAIGSCLGSIVFREHPADDVFVDQGRLYRSKVGDAHRCRPPWPIRPRALHLRFDAKGVHNLLGDVGTTNAGVAASELDDRVDEFLRWPFRAGAIS